MGSFEWSAERGANLFLNPSLTWREHFSPPPPDYLENKRRIETGEAAFETSRRDAPNPCITFEDQGHMSGQDQAKGKNRFHMLRPSAG